MDKPIPNKIGRPSKYTPELADEICHRISDGEPLRKICRDEHMPSWHTVYQWIIKDKDFSSRIAESRELGADAIAEDILDIIDEYPQLRYSEGSSSIDTGYVQWQMKRADYRLKLLSKWSKKYSERGSLEITGKDGGAMVSKVEFSWKSEGE
jgi:hypothetical protein